MVISPDIRSSINEFRAQYWDDRLIGWATVRLLGFADGLFHTTPIIQAIISILLVKRAEKNPYLYIFVVTTLLSALLNSRTSFVVWLFCLFIYLIQRSESLYLKRRNIFILGCCAILIPSLVMTILNENAKEAIEYFYKGMNEIGDASRGNKTGFFELLNKYIVFPSGLDLLFGIGCDTYGSLNNPGYRSIHTDYGFINDVWMYGLIGSLLMTILYLKTIFNCLKLNNQYSRLLFYSLLISFFIGHFKGIITYYNDYTAFLLLVSSSVVLDHKRYTLINNSSNL